MDRRRKITDEQLALIRQSLKNGVKQDAVARHFGISRTQVGRIKREERHARHLHKSVGDALNWLLKGKPVTRDCWQTSEYLRYCTKSMQFELYERHDVIVLEAFEISGYDLSISDWVLGEFDSDGNPIWPER